MSKQSAAQNESQHHLFFSVECLHFHFPIWNIVLTLLRWRSTSLDKNSASFNEVWWTFLLVTKLLRLNWNEAVHIVDNSMMPLRGHKESVSRIFTFFVLGTSVCQLFFFQFYEGNLSLTLIQLQKWKVFFLYLVRFLICQSFIILKICVSDLTAVLTVRLYLVHNGVSNSSNLSEPFFNQSNSSLNFRFAGS